MIRCTVFFEIDRVSRDQRHYPETQLLSTLYHSKPRSLSSSTTSSSPLTTLSSHLTRQLLRLLCLDAHTRDEALGRTEEMAAAAYATAMSERDQIHRTFENARQQDAAVGAPVAANDTNNLRRWKWLFFIFIIFKPSPSERHPLAPSSTPARSFRRLLEAQQSIDF